RRAPPPPSAPPSHPCSRDIESSDHYAVRVRPCCSDRPETPMDHPRRTPRWTGRSAVAGRPRSTYRKGPRRSARNEGRPRDRLVPPISRGIEYGYLAVLGFAQAVSAPLVHVLIAVLALHHHDTNAPHPPGRRPRGSVPRAGLGREAGRCSRPSRASPVCSRSRTPHRPPTLACCPAPSVRAPGAPPHGRGATAAAA